jgi:hypothetical protein
MTTFTITSFWPRLPPAWQATAATSKLAPDRQLTKRTPSPETLRRAPEKARGRGLGQDGGHSGPSLRERLAPQYWPFPASLRRQAVNRKNREFVVGNLAPQMCRPRGHSPETPDGTRWHRQKTSRIGISRHSNQLRIRSCLDAVEQTAKITGL